MSRTAVAAGLLCAAHFTPAAAELPASLSNDTFGCHTRELSSRLIEISQSGDSDAFSRGYASGLLSGECRRFNAGTVVYITDSSLLHGLTSVRERGDIGAFWVPTKHVAIGAVNERPPPKEQAPQSDSERYGSGAGGFERWAKEQFSAEKFRYINANEVWIVTSAVAPDGWYVAAAESIAQHYRSFVGLKGPVTVKVFTNNEQVGAATMR